MDLKKIDVTIYPKVYGKHEPTYIKLDTALSRIKSGAKNLPIRQNTSLLLKPTFTGYMMCIKGFLLRVQRSL